MAAHFQHVHHVPFPNAHIQPIPNFPQINVQNPGPQPDWNTISEELGKARNLPQIVNPQQIYDAINLVNDNLIAVQNQINQNMETMRTQINQSFIDLRDEIRNSKTDMMRCMAVIDQNATARTMNSWITNIDEHLYPLVDTTTGQQIASFPATIRTINDWDGNQCDTFLLAINAVPIPFDINRRRSLIKFRIGTHM